MRSISWNIFTSWGQNIHCVETLSQLSRGGESMVSLHSTIHVLLSTNYIVVAQPRTLDIRRPYSIIITGLAMWKSYYGFSAQHSTCACSAQGAQYTETLFNNHYRCRYVENSWFLCTACYIYLLSTDNTVVAQHRAFSIRKLS